MIQICLEDRISDKSLGFIAPACHPSATVNWDDGKEVSAIYHHQ